MMVTPSASTPSRYDAIVVGAGIAGLVAASDLQQRGHRVLVLEHNHQAGGLMSGMWRHGFYFDVGCQSFEDMGIVFPLLEQYGLSDLARFRRARYRLVMPGLDTVVDSLPQTRRAFQEAFPESAAGFARSSGGMTLATSIGSRGGTLAKTGPRRNPRSPPFCFAGSAAGRMASPLMR